MRPGFQVTMTMSELDHRIDAALESQVLQILREQYADFGPSYGYRASCGPRRSNSRGRGGPVWAS